MEFQKHRIKAYIEREITAQTNMDTLYGVIKGQCSESCIGIIVNDKDHDDKDKTCDMLWLLWKIREITSGLDIKANKRVHYKHNNYHGQDVPGTK